MKTFIILLALFATAQARVSGTYTYEEARPSSDSRIVDGFPAEPGQFPYQAFFTSVKYKGGNGICGGSLISSNWVLTAAHCVAEALHVEVHLGNVSFADAPIKIKSDNLHMHPKYERIGIRNDIALIGLPYSVPLSANIQTIRLALEPSQTYLGREAVVSGFGYIGDDYPSWLRFAPVKIVNNTECLLLCPIYVRDSVVCATGVETVPQGPCWGDSGGPMVLRDNGVLRQVGIVSFLCGDDCFSEKPKGFVRPSHYIPWISQVTGLTFD